MIPTTAHVQIVLDSVQAKYPGNEWVKKCGPDNHDNTCYDPNKPHLVYHIYQGRRRCEHDEGVSCVNLDTGEVYARWIPVGKPVVVEEK